MDKDVHFLASKTQAICGEPREKLTVTRDKEKVTCKACIGALAVTTIVRPEVDPDNPDAAPTPPAQE